MNKNDEVFDVSQGHGDHNDCLFPPESNDGNFLIARIKSVIASGTVVSGTKNAVPCCLGADKPQMLTVIYISGEKDLVNLMTVICVLGKGRSNTFVPAYPECDGADVKVRLTEIHEWANGIEATLEGTVLGDIARDIAFFDTRYALQKGNYEIGKEYTFRMAALAYGVEIVPEEDRMIKIEGRRAEDPCRESEAPALQPARVRAISHSGDHARVAFLHRDKRRQSPMRRLVLHESQRGKTCRRA